MAYNGSGIIAMTGKNCVAIAADMRFGIQQQTLADDFHKVRPEQQTHSGKSAAKRGGNIIQRTESGGWTAP